MSTKIKIIAIVFAIFFCGGISTASPKPSYVWNKMADGIFYTNYSFVHDDGQRTSIYAFQVEPKKLRIDVLTAASESEGKSAEEFAKQNKALLAMNGGFFTPSHKSIGLIVKDGKELNPIHKTSWWSVFAIAGDRPAIYANKDFKNAKGVRMALQVGPRLVIDGTIPKLKEGASTRSAVGITADGKVIFMITAGPGISLNEVARRMSLSRYEGGLECPNAMALDGGGSSQLYAKIGKFELSLPGISKVPNGLAVFQK